MYEYHRCGDFDFLSTTKYYIYGDNWILCEISSFEKYPLDETSHHISAKRLQHSTEDVPQMCLPDIAKTFLNLQRLSESQNRTFETFSKNKYLVSKMKSTSQKGVLTMVMITYRTESEYRILNLLRLRKPKYCSRKCALFRKKFLKEKAALRLLFVCSDN